MTTRFADHLLDGDHASRPAATAVPTGTLYACSDHALIYQSDGATWATWATLGSPSASTPSYRLRKAAAQAIPNNSATTLTWDTEELDTGAYSAGTPTHWITPTTGRWAMDFVLAFAGTAAATSVQLVDWYLNGVAVNLAGPNPNPTTYPIFSFRRIYDLTAGDYFQANAYQNSGSSKNTNPALTTITGTLLG